MAVAVREIEPQQAAPEEPADHLAAAGRTAAEDPRPLRWTRAEYYRLADAGVLEAHPHVELMDGRVVEMSPQKGPHVSASTKTADALRAIFRAGFHVREQRPLAFGEHSEPEPDVAVVPGTPDDYLEDHPREAVLVVEVSDTSLVYDRTRKASFYAAMGIPEYWLIDLVHSRIEVRREPEPSPGEPFGSAYGVINTYAPADAITCLAAPDQSIAVADLLPKASPKPAGERSKPKPSRKRARKEAP